MHYYSFHVSDYIHDTAHLTIEEDLAFRRLLDLYYTQEKPIPNNTHEVARRIRMAKHNGAVQTVLEEFFMFNMEHNYWYHKRCDETIAAYQAKAERNRAVGKLGGRPKANPEETQMVSKHNPNQEPITNNHKPIVKATKGSRLSADFELHETWIEFCQTERPDLNPQKVFDSFKDYWIAKSGNQGVKLDWTATWRNWVRNQNVAKPLFNKADVVHQTVPASSFRDPALVKLDEDRMKSAPPNPEVLARIRAVLGKTA
jgi:uncharacterized protein YdaU (DUF1376 family)